MPVFDNDNIDVLREKVDAWHSVESENRENFCHIVTNLTFLVEQINGHPETSVKMLSEVIYMLNTLIEKFPDLLSRPVVISPPKWVNPWVLTLMILSTSILSSLATMFILGYVHIPIP